MMNIENKFDVNDVKVELYRQHELPIPHNETYDNNWSAAKLHWSGQKASVSGSILTAYPGGQAFSGEHINSNLMVFASLSPVKIKRKGILYNTEGVTFKGFNYVFFKDINNVFNENYLHHNAMKKIKVIES